MLLDCLYYLWDFRKMTKDQPSFSQNPGECYDSFWENADGDNEPSFDIDEHT
jgi:hypothetical protein